MFRFRSPDFTWQRPEPVASEGLPVEELTRETKVDFATEVALSAQELLCMPTNKRQRVT